MATRKIKRFGSEFEVPDIFNKETTESEVMTYIYNFINKQKKPSFVYNTNQYGQYPSCKYRNEDGCCCAVGCVIDDDEVIENASVYTLFDRMAYYSNPKSVPHVIKRILIKAQNCHDGVVSSGAEDFLSSFNKLIVDLGLIDLVIREVNNEQV